MPLVTAPLYLASGSATRKRLLQHADIPFRSMAQAADEESVCLSRPLPELVLAIAELKMKHIAYPQGKEGEQGFFLTADTMTLAASGAYYAKPADREDARRMLRAMRVGSTIGSGFCLDRAVFEDGRWQVRERALGYDEASCLVDIPERFLEFYLDRVPFTTVSGGIMIDGIGEQFVREVRGCYSAILGIPMVKLRESLEKFGFYSSDPNF